LLEHAKYSTFCALPLSTEALGRGVLQTVSLDDEMSSGENVISRWTGRVTHQGALIGIPPIGIPPIGIPPIGKRIDVTTLSIWRVRDGKNSEAWIVFDAPGMTQQLGVASLP
jgi:predicted ester cyclase